MNNYNYNYNYNDNDNNYDNNGDNSNESELTPINSEEELNRGTLNVISNEPNKQTKVTKHKSKKVPSKKGWVQNWFAEVNLPNGKKVSECQVLVPAEKA